MIAALISNPRLSLVGLFPTCLSGVRLLGCGSGVWATITLSFINHYDGQKLLPPTGHWTNVPLPQGRWLPAMAWVYLGSKLGKREEQVPAVLPAVTQAQI